MVSNFVPCKGGLGVEYASMLLPSISASIPADSGVAGSLIVCSPRLPAPVLAFVPALCALVPPLGKLLFALIARAPAIWPGRLVEYYMINNSFLSW